MESDKAHRRVRKIRIPPMVALRGACHAEALAAATRPFTSLSNLLLLPQASNEHALSFVFRCHRPRAFSTAIMRAAVPSNVDVAIGRRQSLLCIGSLISTLAPINGFAYAAKAPSGFQAVVDSYDGYKFLYPFGWQEVAVKGQDCVYKDVIEPLESVSVNIIETSKENIHELGSPEEVADTSVRKVLASASQKAELVEAKERVADGQAYYTFEFVAKAPTYSRHGLGTVTVANGKFFTLTTGANERRWPKMQDKLKTIAESFAVLK